MKKVFARILTVLLVLCLPAHAFALNDVASKSVISWCTTQMSEWSPGGTSKYPDAKESVEDSISRYDEIAQAAFNVAFDPAEPPVFSGARGRSETLALMLSVAGTESGFRKDVDLGVGNHSRGDSGRSWCMMQVMLSQPNLETKKTKMRVVLDGLLWKYAYDGKTGWGGEDLVQDREKCFRVGLHMIRNSLKSCEYLPLSKRLSVYASGSCKSVNGQKRSREKMDTMNRFLRKSPPVAVDSFVFGSPVSSFDGADDSPTITTFLN